MPDRKLSPISEASDEEEPKCSTILTLSNNELFEKTFDCLESLQNPSESQLLHSYFFSSRDDVKKVLALEMKHYQDANVQSIGRLLIPQLCCDLNVELLSHVAQKTLTERHLALAATISYGCA